MGLRQVLAGVVERLRSRELRIPGEEGGHRTRLAEVDHTVSSLVVVEDILVVVVDSREVVGLVEEPRTHLAEDHQVALEAGSRPVAADNILPVVEEGHLEEGCMAAVEDKASDLVGGKLQARLLIFFFFLLAHSRDAMTADGEHSRGGPLYDMLSLLCCTLITQKQEE